MIFKQATRSTVRPLIGLFGKSGGGKTMTALLVARGLVGPQGKIALIDTETGRGSLFADLIPGGYSVLEMEPPFSPENYINAIGMLEGKFDIGVIDSMSHEWNGEGGYLDMKEAALERMAGNDWKKREKCAMAAAAQCKPKHNRLVQKMLRLNIPMILCFRGKEKVKMSKDAQGKSVIESSSHADPIQDSGLIFEMLIAGEVMSREEAPDVGGFFRPTKITHPGIRQFLPAENEQFGIKHGEALAKWASNPSSSPSSATVSQPTPKSAKARLWKRALELEYENSKDGAEKFEEMLKGNQFMNNSETLATLSEGRNEEILAKLS